MNKLSNQCRYNTLFQLFSKQMIYSLVSSFLSFFIIWFIIQKFPISVYGKFSIYQNTIFFLSLFGSGWLTQIVLQRNNRTNIFVYRTYKILIFIIYFFFVIEFILMFILVKSFILSILASLIVIIQILFSIRVAFNYSNLNITNNFFIDMVRLIGLTILLFLFVFFLQGNMSLDNLIIIYFLSNIGLLIAISLNMKFKFTMFKFSIKDIILLFNSDHLKYGWPLIFWSACSYLLNISDRYIIDLYCSNNDLGLYSASYDITNKIISVVILPFSYVFLPLLKNYHENSQFNKLDQTIKKVLLILLLILIIVNIIFYILSFQDIQILGFNLKISNTVMIITSSSILFQMGLVAQKKLELYSENKLLLFYIAFTLAINIVLNLVFIPKYGFEVAAWSSLVSSVLYIVLVSCNKRSFLLQNFESV